MIKTITKLAGLLLVPVMLMAGTAHAAGTVAGTNISNTANVSYTVGTTPFNKPSNTVTTVVSQITDINITALNSPVSVNPGDAASAMAFKVTNTGNGLDTFNLLANSAILGDQFDPTAPVIYADGNGDNIYQPLTDTVVAATTAALPADGYATFFVVNGIPATVLDTQIGLTALTGTSITATGVAGTVTAGAGVGGVDVMVGAAGGTATTQGNYIVTSITITPNPPVGVGPFPPGPPPAGYTPGDYAKAANVTDPYGGTSPVPGATVEYVLWFSVAGSGTATNAIIGDDIPANTTYVPGSIRFSADAGVTITPLADATPQLGGTLPFTAGAGVPGLGQVQVELGNMTSASPVQMVTFKVTIN